MTIMQQTPSATAVADPVVGSDAADAARRKKIGRRGVVALIVGIALIVISAFVPWVSISVHDGLGLDQVVTVAGKSWSPALVPIALALLAGVVAQFLLRGRVLYFAALLLMILEGVALIAPMTVLTQGEGEYIRYILRSHFVADRYVILGAYAHIIGPILAVVGIILAMVGTVLAIRYPKAGTATRYQTPAMRARAVEKKILTEYATVQDAKVPQHLLWDAQNVGVDLTD